MKADISMPKVMRGVTIEAIVTGRRRTGVRLWLGCKIMMIAAAVIGCSIEVDTR